VRGSGTKLATDDGYGYVSDVYVCPDDFSLTVEVWAVVEGYGILDYEGDASAPVVSGRS